MKDWTQKLFGNPSTKKWISLLKASINQDQDQGYWMSSLVKKTIEKIVEADQLLFVIQKTTEMTWEKAFEEGKTEQAKTVLTSLGLGSLTYEIHLR